ncbi:MAG TPA: 6-carboxytetrahydropterin synthase QueD [Firmicutes bacterium]|jgi:6-pyruvoyltetrahydropterin/6-carboxytetrahydropterin synthase|nr:6-carboxytetrahydropterin synthase QueD [Bacillota bacterium]HAW71630.1 6-carboxytetrahydropterin synthase QueD [Bacillota bacterium]HAZ22465.1 6-carboxytetrahydropterin synthase QueD [Bacillota bacterium]HBE05117.1 6-carboxytetrahydropterin synthase QueD [Bacillota bacterium]HBG45350.1 6-carboxytetrahydropterin synthase QueD [Bacillota bacterium]
MYEVTVSAHFDSAHYLREYHGRCENLHGHRWQVEASVRSNKLNQIGLALDFTELKKALRETVAQLDHVCLNDLPEFSNINPSSENIASAIFEKVTKRLHEQGLDFTIYSIKVYESPDAWVTYYGAC